MWHCHSPTAVPILAVTRAYLSLEQILDGRHKIGLGQLILIDLIQIGAFDDVLVVAWSLATTG